MRGTGLEEAISNRRTQRDFQDRSVSVSKVHRLLWAAQGVTDESGKRTAPSAHALHPLNLRFTAGNIDGLEPGTYSVAGDAKTLEPIIRRDLRRELQAAALEDQPWIGEAAGIITVCADFAAASRAFVEQPPYGLRGLRYVYIEAGAVAQNLQLMASADGLGSVIVAGFKDEATADILELEAPITPVMHLCFGWPLLS
ncbi:SagB/ThcOx family dehydrogenase [Pelagibius sp. Alg239-R121]|uniref:SagB/ThcOx family dehydrogenase n=1 Tax=Pelagibius sp. Alg239-R121 TaxID=2993448 RepID=UPI0024A6B909|nr:SagB/ThcOx family dehydrogenase [Pelagibius sp. Alg239-R121]